MIALGFHHGGIGGMETPVGHDAAAAIVVDGRIVAAAEEERFSRVKHTSRFPEHAIRYCLAEAGVEVKDVDAFCFAWDPELDRRNTERVTIDLMTTLGRHTVRHLAHATLFDDFSEHFGYRIPESRRRRYPHHLCHAASAFFCSPFRTAAYLIVDAYGELVSVSYGVGRDGSLEPLKELFLPTSLGVLYQTYTRLLGFHGVDDEYKVMGLAAYGSPERFRPLFRAQWRPTDDGIEQCNDEESRRAVCELGRLRRWPHETLERVHEDVAAALQESLEDQVLHLAGVVRKRTGARNICLAGGVALNSTANGKLSRSGLFDAVFIQPAANDAGVALGAALFEQATILGAQARNRFSAYLGPSYASAATESACQGARAEVVTLHEEDIVKATVERLLRQEIVGWFQGRMEFGPRALGNRSILADPRERLTRDRINRAVKHREEFRPFAPAVVAEEAHRFFSFSSEPESPFMLMTVPVHESMRSSLAAVVHQDNTARVQTVTREQNPRFWELLTLFGQRTGVPVLLNTSLNLNGEPIACTPDDAIETFLSTDLDAIVLDDYLVVRRPLGVDELALLRPRLQRQLRFQTAVDLTDSGIEWRDTIFTRRHLQARVSQDHAALLLAFDGFRTLGELVEALYGPFKTPAERNETLTSAAAVVAHLLRHRFLRIEAD